MSVRIEEVLFEETLSAKMREMEDLVVAGEENVRRGGGRYALCADSESDLAVWRRDQLGAQWRPRTLAEIRQRRHDVSGPVVRILADGIYDLFHWGHAEQFKQIKDMIPNSYLIVGVCRDEDTLKHKRMTVFDDEERTACVMNCRYVDEVIRRFPYSNSFEIMEHYRIDLVAHDCIPYAIGACTEDCYAPFKRADRFLQTQRHPDVSTTQLIKRILDRHDQYSKGKKTNV